MVGLERADAVALISLADPRKPRVLQVASAAKKAAPEGVALHRDPATGTVHVLAANEGNGTLAVFRVEG